MRRSLTIARRQAFLGARLPVAVATGRPLPNPGMPLPNQAWVTVVPFTLHRLVYHGYDAYRPPHALTRAQGVRLAGAAQSDRGGGARSGRVYGRVCRGRRRASRHAGERRPADARSHGFCRYGEGPPGALHSWRSGACIVRSVATYLLHREDNTHRVTGIACDDCATL